MKYIFYYIWLGFAIAFPWMAKVFIPMNMLIMKFGRKSKKDYKAWKKNYSKANLEFPGGLLDWFAFAFLLIFIFTPIIVLIICFSKEIKEIGIFSSKVATYSLLIGVAAFSYYWIYFRNIKWLKERIDKVSKKYHVK